MIIVHKINLLFYKGKAFPIVQSLVDTLESVLKTAPVDYYLLEEIFATGQKFDPVANLAT